MLSDVMDYFGLSQAFDRVGYFETEPQAQLFKELKAAIRQGRLVALAGIVGSGKTVTLQRLQSELRQEKEILVSRSLALDKDRVSLTMLMTALFFDLSTEKDFKLPTQPERRERALSALIQKRRKPVVLFIDDAHGLHSRTLVGLKRLIELVHHDGGCLSVVLAGHPKLKNDLRRPALEEIGARTTAFTLEGIQGQQLTYIQWLLHQCAATEVELDQLVTPEAISLLAERLMTPLQIEQYLGLALEQAYRIGQKPVTPEVVEIVLAQGLDDLEPRLIRNGYNAKVLAQLLNVRTAEVRSFLHGQLSTGRTQDLREQMLKLGIPV